MRFGTIYGVLLIFVTVVSAVPTSETLDVAPHDLERSRALYENNRSSSVTKHRRVSPLVKWLIAGGVGLGVLNIFVQNQNLAYQNINYTATMEVDPVNRGFSDQYLQVIIDWLKTEPRNEEEGETIMKWVRESPNVIQAEIDVAQAAWNERKKKLGEQQNLAPRSHVSSPAINNNLD